LQTKEEEKMERMKPAVLILGFFAIFAVLIPACATVPFPTASAYRMEIDSIALAGADLRGKSYVISSAMQEISDEDLRFKEIALYIENALKMKGYNRVDKKEKAEILIRLAYGIGNPQTTTYTTTTGSGYAYQVGWWWNMVPPTTETVKQTTYQRHLVVEAFDLKTKSDRLPQLWRTALSSEGSSSDIRTVLPHMIAAAVDYFGTNTGRKMPTYIEPNDPRVDDIKYGFVDVNTIKGPFLGTQITTLSNAVKWLSDEYEKDVGFKKKDEGVLVYRVIRNTLAEEMGLLKGDIILEINGKAIREPGEVKKVIQNLKPGEKITILYWRLRHGENVKTGYLK
jgi:hypothetical protein